MPTGYVQLRPTAWPSVEFQRAHLHCRHEAERRGGHHVVVRSAGPCTVPAASAGYEGRLSAPCGGSFCRPTFLPDGNGLHGVRKPGRRVLLDLSKAMRNSG
jgi:hypothetical protein